MSINNAFINGAYTANFPHWFDKRWVNYSYPLDEERKFNVYKTLQRCPGPLLNTLCMFNLRPVSRG